MKKLFLLLFCGLFFWVKSNAQVLHFNTAIVNTAPSPATVYIKIKKPMDFNFGRITLTSLHDSANTHLINVYFDLTSCTNTTLLANWYDTLYSINATFPFDLKIYSIIDTTFHCPSNPTPIKVDSVFFTASQIIALPISFTYITAYKNGNFGFIKWAVDEQANCEKYIVQKAGKNGVFNDVDNVFPDNTKQYTWLDEKLFAGDNFYRIKAVNKDGSFKISSTVRLTDKKERFLVFPNPAKDEINVVGNGIGAVTITNSIGKILLKQKITVIGTTQIDISSLERDVYFLQVQDVSGKFETTKFVKD